MECPHCHSNLLLNQAPPKEREKVYCPVCGWIPRVEKTANEPWYNASLVEWKGRVFPGKSHSYAMEGVEFINKRKDKLDLDTLLSQCRFGILTKGEPYWYDDRKQEAYRGHLRYIMQGAQRWSKTATTTRTKLLETKQQFDAVRPETREKHDLGNGYHIYFPGTQFDLAREGTLMENCLQDPEACGFQREVDEGKWEPQHTYDQPLRNWPEDKLDYYAPALLRDNEGIPHAMWHHYYQAGAEDPSLVPGDQQAYD